MNFYSEEIICDILDYNPLENMIDELENFQENTRKLLHRFSGNDIQMKYVDALLGDDQNKVVFYCMDLEFRMDNCPSIMIYRKSKVRNETRYYILMLCTKPKFRNQGYASKLLDGFVEKVKREDNGKQENTKIILSSVETAVLFYEAYGFRWTIDTLSDHEELMEIEKNEEGKEYFIMEMSV
jgi:GNAT superfamily N-acetyltransferase